MNAKSPSNADLRDKINALRKQRDAHQMDEPDYVDAIIGLLQAHQLDLPTKQLVKTMVNDLETITYYKHHYVRKTGLKRQIKALLAVQRQELLSELLGELPEKKEYIDFDDKATDDQDATYVGGFNEALSEVVSVIERYREGL